MLSEILNDYFQLGPLPANQMTGSYDLRLVTLSFMVACFASYIALDITGRLRDINNTKLTRLLWVVGGALAMGAGIWSMHFIGMLAFSMDMPFNYRPSLTILSFLVAIGASMFALFILKAKIIYVRQTILGGVIFGIAIAAMHYTGMAAMTGMQIHYIPSLFLLSIVVAICASEAALYLALKSTSVIPNLRTKLKLVSAFLMGAAICGMHYTGMAAAVFTPDPMMNMMGYDIRSDMLAISVAGVTFFILAIAFFASLYKESLNQQALITARKAGMAEVATNVLHNIGNVLNSINVSSNVLAENINTSKLSYLTDLKRMLAENNNDIEYLIKHDPRSKHLASLLISLADYWEGEKLILNNETTILTKNVEHIKNIISTQQDMSRTETLLLPVSLKQILNEAILITGIDDPKYQIKMYKHFDKDVNLIIDKVKLLQILINLIQNAKDALLLHHADLKTISFTIKDEKEFCRIEIRDNGVGIPTNHLTKIFAYGFTTKESGHGFGLHSAAVSAIEMGGSLIAESDGKGLGATFILKLPNTLKRKDNDKTLTRATEVERIT